MIHPSNRRRTTEEFIQESKAIHGDKFGYGKVVYLSRRSRVELYCKQHEDYFFQNANSHLAGWGCMECSGRRTLSKEAFVEKAKAIHGDQYDYTDSVYCKSTLPITIFCVKCQIHFDQEANSHLMGHGHRVCHRGGFGLRSSRAKRNAPPTT